MAGGVLRLRRRHHPRAGRCGREGGRVVLALPPQGQRGLGEWRFQAVVAAVDCGRTATDARAMAAAATHATASSPLLMTFLPASLFPVVMDFEELVAVFFKTGHVKCVQL